MEDPDYTPPPPPSAETVARRALVLVAVSYRGSIEGDSTNREDGPAQAMRSFDWLREIGLEDEMTDWEHMILQAPFGGLSNQDRVDASWLIEGTAVMAWALGMTELPAFDVQCDQTDTATGLGFLRPVKETALHRPVLRSSDVLREYSEFMFHLHWRIRDFSLHRRKYDFEALARKAWGEPIMRHGFKLVDGDLSIGGVPITETRKADLRRVESITQERHRASNWLMGDGDEDFYDVVTDT